MSRRPGTVRLFQFRGISVFLHWTWFFVATYEITGRVNRYSSVVWNVVEYLALFAIVTLHEFGHAFACRSVGGRANQIVLWPLGGVAFVDPPPRPGATLWSIAAGPLVNVALLSPLVALTLLTSATSSSDLYRLVRSVTLINVGLLLFNLLPVYPLDGGQILGALLWFIIGRARSLRFSAVVGFGGALGIIWLALRTDSSWLGIIAVFITLQCVKGLQLATTLTQMADAEQRQEFVCPSCHAQPPLGAFWTCSSCGAAFDIFEPSAAPILSSEVTTLNLSARPTTTISAENVETRCPTCHSEYGGIKCLKCGAVAPLAGWKAAPFVSTSSLYESADMTRFRPPRARLVVLLVTVICLAIGAGFVLVAGVFVYGTRSGSVAVAQPVYVALKTSADHVPQPVEGIVTITLSSGAWIKLRARDIDYDRTAAYANRVIIKAVTATVMTANSGRKYMNLTFGPTFVATAWLEDVDRDEMRTGFPTWAARQRASGSPSSVAVAQPVYVALKMTTDRVPEAVHGIVTVTLASGAWIKLRAVDIDSDRTAAYSNRVIIKAMTATTMTTSAGRKYVNFTFGPTFVATAWVEDVDWDEMRAGFPRWSAHERALAKHQISR